MKQYGFTLIELLAVIIILALLMIFVFPSVINSIKKSSETIDQKNLDLIYNAVDVYISKHKSDFPRKSGNMYVISLKELVEDGLLVSPIKLSNSDEDLTDLKSIQVTYHSDFNYKLKDNEDCKIKYSDGTVVYFDVEAGKVCSESEYKVANSNTGYNGYTNKDQSNNQTARLDTQSSCLKFYAFNDEGEEKLNLLLDHNTTASIFWNDDSDKTNINGPKNVINQLKIDTNLWKGTNIPKNYTVDQTGSTSGANYTIYYKDEEYKARLIEVNEIAKIIGYENFDTQSPSVIFFHDKSSNALTGSGNICASMPGGCKYGWLYDRAGDNCETEGCFNNSNENLIHLGYWTSTSFAKFNNTAWFVSYNGGVTGSALPESYVYYIRHGVRPVIEISKEKLK